MRERFSTSLLSTLATNTIRTGASIVQVTLSVTMWAPARYCTAIFTVVWQAEIWKALETVQWTNVRIITINLVSGYDSVASPVSTKSRATASLTRAGILAITPCTVFSNRPDEQDGAGRIVEAGRFSYMSLSAKPSIFSLSCALGLGPATSFSTASNDWDAIDECSKAIVVLNAVVNWQLPWRIYSGLLTTLMSLSHLRLLDSYIRKVAKVDIWKKIIEEGPEWNQGKVGSKKTISAQYCRTRDQFCWTMRGRKGSITQVPNRKTEMRLVYRRIDLANDISQTE